MKCLLFAAGRGTRISRFIQDNPKCTIDIGGVPLIKYTISMLKRHNINDIALCLGYKSQVIKDTLEGCGCKFYYNPFFDVTNSIASAWFCRDFIDGDDILIMNADVYLEEKLLEKILATDLSAKHNELGTKLFMDSARIEEADYKFYCENNYLKKYGKELTADETTGEYIGAAILTKAFLPTFVSRLNELISTQKHSIWWENVIYSLTDEYNVPVIDVVGDFWAEVDYIEDYERIMAQRQKKN